MHPVAQRIFEEAFDLPPEQRGPFIAQECRDDTALRREVESLFEAHGAASRFLAQPTVTPAMDAPASDPDATRIFRDPGAEVADREQPGTVIGNYSLEQHIGEGGFGAVYMAQQLAPVKRKVALKIIKPGMASKGFVARFEAERQALAMMDHPSIARVFDAGTTESGRPYFVMELVDGVSITEYCRAQQLGVLDRLSLFRKVCGAVQHAHQKGIIHRDIKPSNVLVTQVDGEAVPKVIDFGIAKAINIELAERTYVTELRQIIGTPEYMSPEQVDGAAGDIDTRADVYSLGVLLYELLTGSTPFDLHAAAVVELFRIIRESEPEKPSLRNSKLLASGAHVLRRDSREAASTRLIRSDLDWIVMKCLEKDRRRRYDTAQSLADDIQRCLLHEPVMAGPPSAGYRLAKFVRRNRVVVAAGAAIALVVMVALPVTAAALFERTRELERAVQAQDATEQATGRLGEALASVIATARGELAVEAARAPLNSLSEWVDAAPLDRVPRVEVSARLTLALAYESLGDQARGEAMLAAVRAVGGTDGSGPLVAQAFAAQADALARQAQLGSDVGKWERPERLIRRALEMRRAAQPPDALEIARLLTLLGEALSGQDKNTEAEPLLREAIRSLDASAPAHAAAIARAQYNLAVVLTNLSGRKVVPEARDLALSAIAALRSPGSADSHEHADTLEFQARIVLERKSDEKEKEQAWGFFGDALRIRQAAIERTHSARDRFRLAGTLVNLATLKFHAAFDQDRNSPDQRLLQESAAAAQRAIEILDQVVPEGSFESARAHYLAGNASSRANRPFEAEQHFQIARSMTRNRSDWPTHLAYIARTNFRLLLQDQKRWNEAADVCDEFVAMQLDRSAQGPNAVTMANTAILARDAVVFRTKALAADNSAASGAKFCSTRCLCAAVLIRLAVASDKESDRQEKFAQAEELLGSARRDAEETWNSPSLATTADERLVELYTLRHAADPAGGDDVKARECQERIRKRSTGPG